MTEYKAAPFRFKSFLPTSARLSRINHGILADVTRVAVLRLPGGAVVFCPGQ